MSSYYACVLILPYFSSLCYKCPHTLHMCPHTTILILLCVSSCYYVSSYYYICVLILLYILSSSYHMCPHTTLYLSSYYYMGPHTTIYVSSYYYVCVLILLHMCPHTTDTRVQIQTQKALVAELTSVPKARVARRILLEFLVYEALSY
jgi:hypothetical protein